MNIFSKIWTNIKCSLGFHEWVSVPHTDVPACHTVKKCKHCNLIVQKIEHDYTPWEWLPSNTPSCTQKRHCKICNHEEIKSVHNYQYDRCEDCDTVLHCSRCHHEIYGEKKHDYVEIEWNSSILYEKNSITRKCRICGHLQHRSPRIFENEFDDHDWH